MWGMYSGGKANEKNDGANEKKLRSSGDPLLTPYRPLIRLNFYFGYGQVGNVEWGQSQRETRWCQ